MKALVTGGAGFIGSTLVDRLLADGWTVTAVDNLSSGRPANLEAAATHAGFSFVELDIRDQGLAAVVAAAAPDVVFHLAAQIDVRVSVADPALDAGINVVGTLNVLEAARQAGVRKVVFASSGGTIYGDVEPDRIPVDESYPQHPVSPYGVSKKVATDYLFAYAELHGLDFTSLALANVFGPRQDPHGEAGVVAIFAGRLLAGEQCKVFGDGGQTRDYVYVDDVVDAFARAATAGSGELCNIGTGVETSVNDLYRTMADNAGVPDGPEYAPARAGELARSALDASKAGRVLGWVPQTDLRTGTASVLEWFRAQSA
ncbi:MAG: NAD-dependent epimerase/dehydratase family protein [Actinomycetes bacterium]